ncbi:DUF4920 domain-containing protein [Lutibacter sp. A64]|uniref:DUF4920 domain-containing protein n=1 Tax=Lutibacter sp. A64 TaxID=2918526 RepID=UPI001F052FE6|nr:DUF4920 domain-containing protein [Lutibacter sp. A64]UMB53441.1 DUF4920 domain-containing protein [Lutibacter sp. A64]
MVKNVMLVIVGLFLVISCKNEKAKNNEKVVEKEDVAYLSFGDKITDDNVLSKEQMLEKYKDLKEGDTIQVKFTSEIDEVCKKKGCWMNLDLGNDTKSFVKFKDYGFFMPLNADGREVIVNGKAFVKTTPIEELRHFAEDAGKSEEEIAAITEPKYTLSFEADGVLMKK